MGCVPCALLGATGTQISVTMSNNTKPIPWKGILTVAVVSYFFMKYIVNWPVKEDEEHEV